MGDDGISYSNLTKSVTLTILTEKADHDGDCSGNEAEYTAKTKKITIPLPSIFKNYNSGDKIMYDNWENYFLMNEPKINYSGSGFCSSSDECKKHNLAQHDYRLTVIKAKVN